LWVGLGIGLYVVALSISGSALVYLPELTRHFSRNTIVVAESGRRMSVEELTQQAQRAYPTYEVDNIREAQTPEEPDDVVLERAHKRVERLFDPYTIRAQIWAIVIRSLSAFSNGSPPCITTFWREAPGGW
jgi:uncharacterized iron-regulated membrane protein